MNKYKDIFDFFEDIKDINYLVLRNFENLFDNWHNKTDDIDILCDNRDEFVMRTGAILCRNKPDCYNYYIMLNDYKLRIDIREIGDGYYDRNWGKHMLDNRVWHDKFNIMPKDDYYYSLLYHALIQKPVFADKYFVFLKEKLCLKNKHIIHCGYKLIKYMKKNGYNFTVPLDSYVALNKKHFKLLSFMKHFVLS